MELPSSRLKAPGFSQEDESRLARRRASGVVCYTVCMHLANNIVFAGSVVNRSHG